MEKNYVHFSVIKEKIIKTDEVIQMFKKCNIKLKKTQLVCKDFKSKLDQAALCEDRLQLENERINHHLKDLEKQNTDITQQNKNLSQHLLSLEESYNKVIVDSQSTIRELRNELQLQQELDSHRNKKSSKNHEELENEIQQLLLKNEELQAKLSSSESACAETNKLRSDILSQSKEIENLRNQLKVRESRDQETTEREVQKCLEMKKLTDDLTTIKRELENIKNENSRLKKEINEREKVRIEMQSKLFCSVHSQTETDFSIINLQENNLESDIFSPIRNDLQECSGVEEDTESVEKILHEMSSLPEIISPIQSPIRTYKPVSPILSIVLTPSTPPVENIQTDNRSLHSRSDHYREKSRKMMQRSKIIKFYKSEYAINKRYTKFINRSIRKKKPKAKFRSKIPPSKEDTLLHALKVLKDSNINFSIYNESVVPIDQWVAENYAHSSNSALKSTTQQRPIKVEPCIYSKHSKPPHYMMINNRSELLGFFNVKNEEATTSNNATAVNDNNKLNKTNLETIVDQVIERLQQREVLTCKRWKKKRISDSLHSDTETEIERLFTVPGLNVLEQNKMLLNRAKYENGILSQNSNYLIPDPSDDITKDSGVPTSFVGKLSQSSQSIDSPNDSTIQKIFSQFPIQPILSPVKTSDSVFSSNLLSDKSVSLGEKQHIDLNFSNIGISPILNASQLDISKVVNWFKDAESEEKLMYFKNFTKSIIPEGSTVPRKLFCENSKEDGDENVCQHSPESPQKDISRTSECKQACIDSSPSIRISSQLTNIVPSNLNYGGNPNKPIPQDEIHSSQYAFSKCNELDDQNEIAVEHGKCKSRDNDNGICLNSVSMELSNTIGLKKPTDELIKQYSDFHEKVMLASQPMENALPLDHHSKKFSAAIDEPIHRNQSTTALLSIEKSRISKHDISKTSKSRDQMDKVKLSISNNSQGPERKLNDNGISNDIDFSQSTEFTGKSIPYKQSNRDFIESPISKSVDGVLDAHKCKDELNKIDSSSICKYNNFQAKVDVIDKAIGKRSNLPKQTNNSMKDEPLVSPTIICRCPQNDPQNQQSDKPIINNAIRLPIDENSRTSKCTANIYEVVISDSPLSPDPSVENNLLASSKIISVTDSSHEHEMCDNTNNWDNQAVTQGCNKISSPASEIECKISCNVGPGSLGDMIFSLAKSVENKAPQLPDRLTDSSITEHTSAAIDKDLDNSHIHKLESSVMISDFPLSPDQPSSHLGRRKLLTSSETIIKDGPQSQKPEICNDTTEKAFDDIEDHKMSVNGNIESINHWSNDQETQEVSSEEPEIVYKTIRNVRKDYVGHMIDSEDKSVENKLYMRQLPVQQLDSPVCEHSATVDEHSHNSKFTTNICKLESSVIINEYLPPDQPLSHSCKSELLAAQKTIVTDSPQSPEPETCSNTNEKANESYTKDNNISFSGKLEPINHWSNDQESQAEIKTEPGKYKTSCSVRNGSVGCVMYSEDKLVKENTPQLSVLQSDSPIIKHSSVLKDEVSDSTIRISDSTLSPVETLRYPVNNSHESELLPSPEIIVSESPLSPDPENCGNTNENESIISHKKSSPELEIAYSTSSSVVRGSVRDILCITEVNKISNQSNKSLTEDILNFIGEEETVNNSHQSPDHDVIKTEDIEKESNKSMDNYQAIDATYSPTIAHFTEEEENRIFNKDSPESPDPSCYNQMKTSIDKSYLHDSNLPCSSSNNMPQNSTKINSDSKEPKLTPRRSKRLDGKKVCVYNTSQPKHCEDACTCEVLEPLKRKRGRPRKTSSQDSLVKNEDCDVSNIDLLSKRLENSNTSHRKTPKRRKPLGKLKLMVLRQMKAKKMIFCTESSIPLERNDSYNQCVVPAVITDTTVKPDKRKAVQPPKIEGNKKIRIVQNILIKPSKGDLLDVKPDVSIETLSSSQVNPSLNSVPSIEEHNYIKSCETDILSKILSGMDRDRTLPIQKTSDNKMSWNGIGDKEWRKNILDIAEITCQVDEDLDRQRFLDIISNTPLTSVKKKLLAKRQLLVDRLLLYSMDDNIPLDVVFEFKRMDVDTVTQIILQRSIKLQEAVSTEYYPAPLMTKSERIFLALMARLKNDKMSNIFDIFLDKAQKLIFRVGCTRQQMVSVTRLYVAICRLQGDVRRMRLFYCEAFYRLNDNAMPLLFTILKSWSEIFPHEQNVRNFPLAKVIVQILNSAEKKPPFYNLGELRNMLNQFYGYSYDRWNCDKLFDELTEQFLRSPTQSSGFAIKLMCKYMDHAWVIRKIDTFFKPLIYKIPSENENFKATVILLLGYICKPLDHNIDEVEKFLIEIRQWFEAIIEDGTPEIVRKGVHHVVEMLSKKKKSPCRMLKMQMKIGPKSRKIGITKKAKITDNVS